MLAVTVQQQSNMLNIGVFYDSKRTVLMSVFQYSSKKSYKEGNVTPDIEKFKSCILKCIANLIFFSILTCSSTKSRGENFYLPLVARCSLPFALATSLYTNHRL